MRLAALTLALLGLAIGAAGHPPGPSIARHDTVRPNPFCCEPPPCRNCPPTHHWPMTPYNEWFYQQHRQGVDPDHSWPSQRR
jgi:hypothetical protein